MGLDIGAVNINYLARPSGAAYRFAWHLEPGQWDDDDLGGVLKAQTCSPNTTTTYS